MRLLISLLAFLCSSFAYAVNSNDIEPPKIGNFALSISQQPGPLVSFGQNILSKNETQVFLFADDFVGVGKHYIDVVPGVLYGITDDLSVFLNTPIAASFKEQGQSSSGLEDAFLQFEYAFYTKSTSRYSDQATIVTNISFPTGSAQKQPLTGFGAPGFFLGTTFNRMYVDWFMFTSHGATLTTSHDHTKIGDQFLYQGGFGRNIANTKKWMYAWMVEADGQYSGQDKINGATNPNSGGNVVYVTPSLWASSKRVVAQLGVGLPVTQHLFGNQKRESYLLVANVGWAIF